MSNIAAAKSRADLETLIKEARVIILNGGHPGDSVVDQWLADTEQWHVDVGLPIPPYVGSAPSGSVDK